MHLTKKLNYSKLYFLLFNSNVLSRYSTLVINLVSRFFSFLNVKRTKKSRYVLYYILYVRK